MQASDVYLLTLHALRLKGFAEAGAVADLYGLDVELVEKQLDEQAEDELVSRRASTPVGWRLTAKGRAENERLLATELDAAQGRETVTDIYRMFGPLNQRLLAICTRWQVKDLDARALNAHDDHSYDAAVISELEVLDGESRPITSALTGVMERFGVHGPRLANAMAHVRAGDHEWFTRPDIASYHTVWFELHEDLLATLGLDRASGQFERR